MASVYFNTGEEAAAPNDSMEFISRGILLHFHHHQTENHRITHTLISRTDEGPTELKVRLLRSESLVGVSS